MAVIRLGPGCIRNIVHQGGLHFRFNGSGPLSSVFVRWTVLYRLSYRARVSPRRPRPRPPGVVGDRGGYMRLAAAEPSLCRAHRRGGGCPALAL